VKIRYHISAEASVYNYKDQKTKKEIRIVNIEHTAYTKDKIPVDSKVTKNCPGGKLSLYARIHRGRTQ